MCGIYMAHAAVKIQFGVRLMQWGYQEKCGSSSFGTRPPKTNKQVYIIVTILTFIPFPYDMQMFYETSLINNNQYYSYETYTLHPNYWHTAFNQFFFSTTPAVWIEAAESDRWRLWHQRRHGGLPLCIPRWTQSRRGPGNCHLQDAWHVDLSHDLNVLKLAGEAPTQFLLLFFLNIILN